MKYLRAFEVKYLGPTNHRGSRVKISDIHRSYEGNISVIIPFDYSYNNSWEVAEAYLKSRNIKVFVRCGSYNKDLLLSKNFATDLK